MQAVFKSLEIECAGCAASIQRALGEAPGVHHIQVDIPSQTVSIDFDPSATSMESLAGALDEIGFPVSES